LVLDHIQKKRLPITNGQPDQGPEGFWVEKPPGAEFVFNYGVDPSEVEREIRKCHEDLAAFLLSVGKGADKLLGPDKYWVVLPDGTFLPPWPVVAWVLLAINVPSR
jgi:hypothetical protein